MDPLPGFISVPRLAGSPRPTGAFFSATVVGPVAPGQWRVDLDGKTLVITSALELTPGQELSLRLVGQKGGQWLLRAVASPALPPVQAGNAQASSLVAAFLSRGLPAAADRLTLWTRWLSGKAHSPHDKESWAASLEARGAGPHAPLTEAIEPWLAWQAALEAGGSPEPPDDEACWDEWNLRGTPDQAPWLVMPLRWEYQGRGDSGLLQAHWNPQGQVIDRWHVTAAPAGVPFRLEAMVRPRSLDLTWRFFRSEDRRHWFTIAKTGRFSNLSTPDLAVSLVIDDVGPPVPLAYPRGIDVEA